MKIVCKMFVSALFSVLIMFSAYAGFTQPAPVDVDLVNNIVTGDMVSARYDDDDDVFIGCGIRNFDSGDGATFEFGFCQAEDAEGERALCSTDSPHLLDAIKAISDYSFITYSFDVVVDDFGNENLICRRIGNSTQSFYIPNIKTKKVK